MLGVWHLGGDQTALVLLALLVFMMAECLSVPLSICSPVSSYRQVQLQSLQMWTYPCIWSSQSIGSSRPQGLTTGGVNKPCISSILRNYTYIIVLERKEASRQNELGSQSQLFARRVGLVYDQRLRHWVLTRLHFYHLSFLGQTLEQRHTEKQPDSSTWHLKKEYLGMHDHSPRSYSAVDEKQDYCSPVCQKAFCTWLFLCTRQMFLMLEAG